MDNKILRFSIGGALTPIETSALAIGTVVTNDYYEGLWTITGPVPSGYVIANDKGEIHHGQQTDCRGPRTRITPIEPLTIKSAEHVTAIMAAVGQKKESDRIAREAAAEEKKQQTEKFIAELRAKYQWAKPVSNKMSTQARAAANMRQELAQTFPGVKFSVRSSSASMTNSVDVEWTLGPTTKEVDAITSKYQYNQYDVHEDYHGIEN